MPITLQDIKEHQERFGITDFGTMPIDEYRQLLAGGALFWIDHHDAVRSTLSEEIFATNLEQLDAVIEHLQSYREKMSKEAD